MNRQLLLVPFLLAACLIFAGENSNADVTISYGTVEGGTIFIDLQAETANQVVQIFGIGIAADGGADGFEFDAQVGDGGSAVGGTDSAPTITGIDLITGTIWESNGTQTDVEVNPLARQSVVDTSSLVSVDGLVATIVFDTTGFGTGEIDFLLTQVAGQFDTTFSQGASALTTIAPNGVIRITAVPEPATAGILFGIGCAGIFVRRRRS